MTKNYRVGDIVISKLNGALVAIEAIDENGDWSGTECQHQYRSNVNENGESFNDDGQSFSM